MCVTNCTDMYCSECQRWVCLECHRGEWQNGGGRRCPPRHQHQHQQQQHQPTTQTDSQPPPQPPTALCFFCDKRVCGPTLMCSECGIVMCYECWSTLLPVKPGPRVCPTPRCCRVVCVDCSFPTCDQIPHQQQGMKARSGCQRCLSGPYQCRGGQFYWFCNEHHPTPPICKDTACCDSGTKTIFL